ncbi:MAG: hypothetical protein KAI66_09115, partial [Lentisphaeria bacterium]|nr:hypothetical protein [Lentisphaeria bacterium]
MNSMRSGVLVCVLLACAWCGWAAEIAVESRSLTIRLASPEEGMGVVGLAHRPSGTRFLKAPESASAALLWKLELTTDLADDDAFFGLTNRNRTGVRSVGREGDDLLLSWDKIDLPDEPDALDVQVRITPRGRHGLGEWRIRVVNRSKRVGIYRVIFPVLELGRIGADGG